MKKKIMAVFVTVMMCLSLCGMMSVSAEETGGTILFGDVNLDSKVSVLDVITISKYNAEIITLNEDQLLAADCDADGVVSLNDVDSLMNRMVDNIIELPAEVKARERDYFENHTFEEFLALSEEEIRAMTNNVSAAYIQGKNEEAHKLQTAFAGTCEMHIGFQPEYADLYLTGEKDWLGENVVDIERMAADLKLPVSLFSTVDGSDSREIDGVQGYFVYWNTEDFENYDCEYAELVGRIFAWIWMNPKVNAAFHEAVLS